MLEVYWSKFLRDSCRSSCRVSHRTRSAIHTFHQGCNNHKIELMKQRTGISTSCCKLTIHSLFKEKSPHKNTTLTADGGSSPFYAGSGFITGCCIGCDGRAETLTISSCIAGTRISHTCIMIILRLHLFGGKCTCKCKMRLNYIHLIIQKVIIRLVL